VERFIYEELHPLHLQFSATNGVFSGSFDDYWGVGNLEEIGNGLTNFPKRIGDEYKYEAGSSRLEDNYAYHFILRAYTTGSSGHCALQFTINKNSSPPHEGICTFSIPAEVAAINRLGKLFCRFAKLEHHKFVWTETDESLD